MPETAEFFAERIRDVSEAVYREQLGAKDVAAMIEKDQDQGQKLRNRAVSYDRHTTSYMRVFRDMHPDTFADVFASPTK